MSTRKNPLHLSLISFSVSVITASTIGFFASPSSVQAQKVQRPTTARVTGLTNGDVACYVDLVDAKGKSYNIVGNFDLCSKQKTYLKKRVRLTYGKTRISNCQSAEPCGQTRVVTAIKKMQVIR